MTTVDTPTEFQITFENRDMRVILPNEDQLAVLIASQEFFRRHMRRMDEILPELEALGAARTAEHPVVQEAARLNREGMKHAGRFQTILQTLLLDQADWDFIQDGMADKSIKWQHVADIPALIIEAHNAQTGEPLGGNRATRRAKKTTGRLAR